MGKLTMGVLGTFEASLLGRPLRSFRTKSVQALLIYLAKQPESAQRREHLLALLWPGCRRFAGITICDETGD